MPLSPETAPKPGLTDNQDTYGLVSRFLHWLMAALFLWQLISAGLHLLAPKSAAKDFFWSGHYTVGVLLLALVIIRALWGLANLSRRPLQQPGLWGVAAKAGHLILYLLMIAIPSIALIRAYGFGRGMKVLGIELFAPTGEKVDWMVQLGGLLHGELGWFFFVLVAGHILVAVAHRKIAGTEVLYRMGISR